MAERSISTLQEFNKTGKTPPQRIPIVNRSIGGFKLRRIIALYSLGNNFVQIREDLLSLIENMEDYWPHEFVMFDSDGKKLKQYLDYDDMLWLLSIAYLLRIPQHHF